MKNVTVKLEAELIRAARHEAVEAELSLSAWLAELIREKLGRGGSEGRLREEAGTYETGSEESEKAYEEARARALQFLEIPRPLGGNFDREALHDERTGKMTD